MSALPAPSVHKCLALLTFVQQEVPQREHGNGRKPLKYQCFNMLPAHFKTGKKIMVVFGDRWTSADHILFFHRCFPSSGACLIPV